MTRIGRRLLLASLALYSCARVVPPPAPTPVPEPAPAPAGEAVGGEPAGAASEPPPPSPGADAGARDTAAAPARRVPSVPSRVRVGLASDLGRVELPCCDGQLTVTVGGRRLAVLAPLAVKPAAGEARPGIYRVQVAALRDEAQAAGLARHLGAVLGVEASVVFDAGSGLYRVRVGAYRERAEAEAERRRLEQRNVHGAWVVSEQGSLAEPALAVRIGERSWRVPGRWLELESASGEGIGYGGKSYRGRLLVFLNDRGSLNLVNDVLLDDYLRGVVPREMGPDIYDDLEALKAQAVAARTYTLRNMGEFAGEGYDICATPRCQVYGGRDAEHEVSDRAVTETSGEVLLFEGELVDALYSSTCGGHTEDVRVVFPLKDGGSYLRPVPCLEAGVDRLAGGIPAARDLEAAVARLLVPVGEGEPQAVATRRLRTLARLAGLAVPEDALASLERREVQRFVASQFDLALNASLFVAHEDLAYLLASPPEGWSEEDLKLAAYLSGAGLLPATLEDPLSPAELDETLFHLALFLRVLEQREVRYLASGEGRLVARGEGGGQTYELDGGVLTYRRLGDRTEPAVLALVPGDRLTLVLRGGRPLAILQHADPDGVAYDRTSNLSSWSRFRSDAELARLVRARYPDLDYRGFEIAGRGASGRVARLRLLGRDGSEVEVRGLPVRWTFDLPDTLFTASRLEPPGGEPGWLFRGRGWGHGVGMCQVGAYGMALRGHDYENILRHYYSGVELVRLAPPGAAAETPAP